MPARVILPISNPDLRRLYEGGAGMQDLAGDLQCSPGVIIRHVISAGASIRPRGGEFIPRMATDLELRELYEAGLSYERIGSVVSMPLSVVTLRVKRAGGESRPWKGWAATPPEVDHERVNMIMTGIAERVLNGDTPPDPDTLRRLYAEHGTVCGAALSLDWKFRTARFILAEAGVDVRPPYRRAAKRVVRAEELS